MTEETKKLLKIERVIMSCHTKEATSEQHKVALDWVERLKDIGKINYLQYRAFLSFDIKCILERSEADKWAN